MIIFGTRGVKSTVKSGNFNCPQCQENRFYRHRKVRNFFTLYFIPLIPLGSAGEYVECSDCKGTFIPRVLINNPDKDEFLAIYEKAIRHAMVLIMLADGVIDDKEKEQVLKIINKFGSNDLTMPDLESYIKLVKEKNEDITTYLKKVGPALNEHGKETVIRCALAVAAADGKIDDTELYLISKMGKSMQMSPSHLKGIMSELHELKE
jgi:uncharacterized tellurite resistance protein B-like protein